MGPIKFFILFCLFVFNSGLAFAQTWEEIEVDQVLIFDQKIILPGSALAPVKNASNIIIKTGDKFKVTKIQSLDSINVIVYVGDLLSCSSQGFTSVMEIVKILHRTPSTDVGLMLEEKCQLSIYIETKELYHPTFFAN